MTMLIDQPTLRPGLFRLPDEPIAERVLIPSFSAATSVRGAFGWFSAGWVERLAPGLAEYLNRHDTTPIQFTVAPALFPAERAAVEKGLSATPDEAAALVAQVFTNGRVDASALALHALDCLSWMIAERRLILRIAVPIATSNYHPKIWLFDDGRYRVLARGSGNATIQGVAEGIEHLDVDVSWRTDSNRRVEDGVAILDDWMEGISVGIRRVVDLPEALREDIVTTAPVRAPTRDDYMRATGHSTRVPHLHRSTNRAPRLRRLRIPESIQWRTGPYAHQGEAVTAWERAPHAEHGIVSMATGAGKTLTALVCATRVQQRLDETATLLVVISAPSIPIIAQWRDRVKEFGVTPIVPNFEQTTDGALSRLFRALWSSGTTVLVITNNLLCSPAFQSTLMRTIAGSKATVHTMLISDEVHTLGAEGFLANQPSTFERRLGLSATPERQYDPDGTEKVLAYFGGTVYAFGLDRAIGLCLVPYHYYVHIATLQGDELAEFDRLSSRIGAAFNATPAPDDTILTRLLIARRRILETTDTKIELTRRALAHRGPREISHVLIYVSAKNPQQFLDVANILTELNIKWASVTQETTSNRRLLERTINTFSEGATQVLLAKKVLDEGIDIPAVREAFIIASSTVEREWIQRRGRVLRRHPNKPWAVVHDFLSLPPASSDRTELPSSQLKIVQNELGRAYSFASHALNAAGDDGVLAQLRSVTSAYWNDGRSTDILYEPGTFVLSPTIPKGALW